MTTSLIKKAKLVLVKQAMLKQAAPAGLWQQLISGPKYTGMRKMLLTHGGNAAIGGVTGAVAGGPDNRLSGAAGGAIGGVALGHGASRLASGGHLGTAAQQAQRAVTSATGAMAQTGLTRQGIEAARRAANKSMSRMNMNSEAMGSVLPAVAGAAALGGGAAGGMVTGG